MKAVFPKNIKKGLLSGLNFPIGPITISIVQLFILAIGIAIALIVFSRFSQTSKVAASFFAIFDFFLFSLSLLFLIFQNWILSHFLLRVSKIISLILHKNTRPTLAKPAKQTFSYKKFKIENNKQKIDYKTKLELENIDKIDSSGLL